MNARIRKFLKWGYKKLFSTPNRKIITVSSIFSLLSLYLSTCCYATWQDFLINLSAGFLTVVFTVLLVDRLRISYERKQNVIPRMIALKRLRADHTGLILQISARFSKNNPEFAKSLVDAGTKMNNGENDSLVVFLGKYAKKFIEADVDKLLADFDDDELQNSFKEALEHLRESLLNDTSRYSFSFDDVAIKTDLADLLNRLDGVIDSYSVYGIDPETLKMIIRSDQQEMKAATFVAIMLKGYLEAYLAFANKYIDTN